MCSRRIHEREVVINPHYSDYRKSKTNQEHWDSKIKVQAAIPFFGCWHQIKLQTNSKIGRSVWRVKYKWLNHFQVSAAVIFVICTNLVNKSQIFKAVIF